MDATNAKIEQLLSVMSLAEKIGQMTQLTNSMIMTEVDINADGSHGDVWSLSPEKVANYVRQYHIGSFFNGIAVSEADWVAFLQELQEVNLTHNRHGIPILYGIDHMHGASYLAGSTVFPHRNNLGATFDIRFSAAEAAAIGRETAHLGHHWVFAPVVDLGANPRFPRFYETYGEDPLICGRMGAAYVDALENHPETAPFRQAACAKHFVGYADSQIGWDRTSGDISPQRLQEWFIPPFQALVDAGVKTFMINGGELNGLPVHASRWLLTEVLREQMGFRGVIVSDWEDIIRLNRVHSVAEDEKAAIKLAIHAGIDMSMTPFRTDFAGQLRELVQDGEISAARIDASVRRILQLKFDLGLFEQPFPGPERNGQLRRAADVQMAQAAAEESLVLLKNENLLPLSPTTKVLLMGPNADIRRATSGGWTLRWIPTEERLFPPEAKTIREGLQDTFGTEQVSYLAEQSLPTAAQEADVILYAGGEPVYSEGSGNIYDLTLDSVQQADIQAAVDTGKPVILLMVAGRPRIIRKEFQSCQAVVWAGLPGYEGAHAIARLLKGEICPSGKLPFSYPNYPGHLLSYAHKLMDLGHYQAFKNNESHMVPFGHGLSYTQFRYENLQLSASQLTESTPLVATVEVVNEGERTGKETVLWFLHDEYASRTRPLKQLKHFDKQEIAPGERKTYTFTIDPWRDLSFPWENGQKQLEKGRFTLMVGPLAVGFQLV